MWDPNQVHYAWMRGVPELARRFDLDDVSAEHRTAGITQVVLVQAADSIDDTEHMLTAARAHPRVAGVVAWVPIDDADEAEAWLDRWHGEPIVGVRHLVHRDPDPDLLVDDRVAAVLDLLSDRRLPFDVCAETEHLLALVPVLAERHPDLTLVIDHLAKPPIHRKGWQPWAQLLNEAAQAPNVVVKLSGLNTAAAPGASSSDYRPYVDHALATFGPERMMYGGDWPFAMLAAHSYTQICSDLLGCLVDLDTASRRAVMAGTARRVYELDDPHIRA